MFAFAIVSAVFVALAAATNTITFKSLDDVDRSIYVTASSGSVEGSSPFDVPAGSSVSVNFDGNFIGNAYAIHKNATNTPGMLAEIMFNGWSGLTYFDVSAIVDATDVDNIKEMYPANSPNTPTSGCVSFPCNNAYYLPDDVQTKSTDQTQLIVTLSKNGGSSKRNVEAPGEEGENFPRKYVLQRF